jgi:hypothetical protein
MKNRAVTTPFCHPGILPSLRCVEETQRFARLPVFSKRTLIFGMEFVLLGRFAFTDLI